MKKILVTGGAGFIGSEFVRQGVSNGYRIIVVDGLSYAGDRERLKECKKEITFYNADINNNSRIDAIFKKESPDLVVHWAAESHVDRSIIDAAPFIDTNVKGTLVLLNSAMRYGVERFVNISTDEVYGELGGDGQFYETTPLNPNSPYSTSKASADMLGRAYFRTHGLPVITVRPSNNYGPWQYPEKLIPLVILKAMSNEPVPVYGRGENIREWLYVADCADAVFRIVKNGIAGEAYNIGSGQERRNIDVVKAILKLLGKDEGLIEFIKDRAGHDFRYSLNSDKIRQQLDWQAQVKFEEGIEKTVKWYMDNIKWVNTKLGCLKDYWKGVYKK
ncbi:MAG: dTDP-glucose 4,6-dehydratase [Nitrospirae bacterium]|nr:dTDP-glucose 4,6-dehydratase [Nitrospirota bacterium]